MTALPRLLLAAVTLTTINTFGTTKVSAAATCLDCPKGSSSLDTCGSCTFTDANFCGWRNTETAKWKPTEDAGNDVMYVATGWRGIKNAILAGPTLCHRRGGVVCLKFRYSFSITWNGKLSLQVCRTDCVEKFTALRNDSGRVWHTKALQFTVGGAFRIRFIGSKTRDGYGPESSIYLDDIEYKRGTCDGTVTTTSAGNSADHTEETPDSTTASPLVSVVLVLIVVIVGTIIASVIVVRRRQQQSARSTQQNVDNEPHNVLNVTPCPASTTPAGWSQGQSTGSEEFSVLPEAKAQPEWIHRGEIRVQKKADIHIYETPQYHHH